jgi:hypothetical protein
MYSSVCLIPFPDVLIKINSRAYLTSLTVYPFLKHSLINLSKATVVGSLSQFSNIGSATSGFLYVVLLDWRLQ